MSGKGREPATAQLPACGGDVAGTQRGPGQNPLFQIAGQRARRIHPSPAQHEDAALAVEEPPEI